LFGSQYYTENPIIPLDKTIAAINLDMVGRTRTPADTGTVMGDEINVVGADSIGVIGGLQSKILMNINEQTLAQMKCLGIIHIMIPIILRCFSIAAIRLILSGTTYLLCFIQQGHTGIITRFQIRLTGSII